MVRKRLLRGAVCVPCQPLEIQFLAVVLKRHTRYMHDHATVESEAIIRENNILPSLAEAIAEKYGAPV